MKKITVVLVVAASVALFAGCQQQGGAGRGGKVKGLERVHFDFDKSDIKPEFAKVLKGNANYLKDHGDMNVVIEGHCDERGTEEYNIALGHRRANSAKSYLASLGVASARMTTKSYGEEKPMEKCHNESCWWKNRRADFRKK